MPPPGSLIALMSMMEDEENVCICCRKPLRDKGKFIIGNKGVSFYCDRYWCRFMRWLRGPL